MTPIPKSTSIFPSRRQFLQSTFFGFGSFAVTGVWGTQASGKSNKHSRRPNIRRLGTLDFGVNETTPIVFRDRLYRLEYINRKYHRSSVPNDYFRFVDVETGELTPPFALDHHLGSAYVEDETVYVFGVQGGWGGEKIDVLSSTDLINWTSQTALAKPGWRLYNNSVCKGDGRYIMAFEVGDPPDVVGNKFTSFFAESDDLLNWEFLGEEIAWTKEFYIGCPTIRFLDGYYYIFYLVRLPERLQPDDDALPYETHLVRTRDFVTYEQSPLNPVLTFDEGDRTILNPQINAEQQQRIAQSPNTNVSDMDLCEFGGEVIFYYSWGSQRGIEYLAEARYTGTLAEFLQAYYP
ncbi:MAG: hypothetical protein O2955_09670 [Planctomycetota bacterium]|nr:hypothetical protein [Planctomycetota bacterium]MDA1212777.1 hypothetical protein [Planctomycetota bacterium]